MRLSVLISILIHVLILYLVLTFFNIVPRVNLPDRVYSVRIFSPSRPEQEKQPEQEVKVEESEPEPVVEEKPLPEPEKEEPEEKPEEKPPPKPEPEKDESVDVTVEEGSGEETSVAVDAPEFPFSYYLSAIERKVSSNWFSGSVEHGTSRSCLVFFRLNRSGGISGLRIEESSGDSYFDRAALRAVRSSAPFPPLPGAFDEPSLGIHFKFVQRD